MSWTLPPEITFKILDLIWDDSEPDSLTSLVCSSWRDYSQQLLFRTLRLTIRPPGQKKARGAPAKKVTAITTPNSQTSRQRLQGLASPSSSQVLGHVRSLVLKFPESNVRKVGVWIRENEDLLVEVLRALPLEKLTTFELDNKWEIFDYHQHRHVVTSVVPAQKLQNSQDESIIQPLFPSLSSCIEDICASPTLSKLALGGRLPFLRLISRCGPALEVLRTVRLQNPRLSPGSLPPSQSYLAPLDRHTPINLKSLTIRYAYPRERVAPNDPPWEGQGSLTGYLFDSPRSLFNLKSLSHLEIVGGLCFDETFLCLFAICQDSLESLVVRYLRTSGVHPSTISLRSARNLKQLSFFSPRAGNSFTDFLDWLLRELTWDNQAAHHHHSPERPSSLENLTLVFRPHFWVRDIAATYAGILSDILTDEHHYPNLKQVRFAVIPEDPRCEWTTTQEELARESRHKEETARAMRALEEKGILLLQWA
jgi:hypothetical protein